MASKIEISNVSKKADSIISFTVEITAHTDGTVESVATPFNLDGFIILAIVVPSATVAPQASYDIELQDENGVDIMGGALSNLSATDPAQAMPLFGTDFFAPRFVSGPLTIAMSGNNISGAKTALTLFIKDA